MSANTPPKPHREGMVFTNDETGIKYQFSGGAWRAVSSSASEEVAEAIDNIDLEKVLGNGNIADKDIVLTDGVDDLIDISPTEGRIIIASGQFLGGAHEQHRFFARDPGLSLCCAKRQNLAQPFYRICARAAFPHHMRTNALAQCVCEARRHDRRLGEQARPQTQQISMLEYASRNRPAG